MSLSQLRVAPMWGIMSGLAGFLFLTNLGFGAVLTTEDEIRHAIIGNTVSGTEDGKPYAEYYRPDGNVHGEEPEGPYVGEWRITGREFCTRYFEEDHSVSAWECKGVDVSGSHFAWVEDGDRYEARLVLGNPNKM